MRKIAIMRGIHFGVRDIGRAILSFEADEGDMSSLQILGANETIDLIEKHQITDVLRDLEGHPCWVDSDGSTSRFIDLHTSKP